MKAWIRRVTEASVMIDGKVSISIKPIDATASTFFIRARLMP